MRPATPARTLAFVLAAAVAGVAAALTAGGGVAGAAAPAPGSQYVALGDSYAAGYGIGTSTNQPVAGCAQSTQDYPHQIAAKLKLKLTDVACSGAVTANIDQTPQNTGNGTAPLQDASLSSQTTLVTVSIGGNDFGFSSIAEYCLAGTANGPVLGGGLNCKAHYDDPSNAAYLPNQINNVVVPNVKRVLADIKAKAPHAAVYFVDYPAISTTKAASPDPATYAASCFSPVTGGDAFPFTAVDTPYLQQVQQQLDAALGTQVGKSGDHFVESYPQSLTHSACAGTKDPWLNGITLQGAGTKAGSLHPNLEGAQHLAAEALAAIGPYVAPKPSPSSRASSSSASNAPAAASSTPLANSGPANALPLSVTGAALVLAGALLLAFTRRSARRGSHGR